MANFCRNKQKYHWDLFTLVRTKSVGGQPSQCGGTAPFSQAASSSGCGLWKVLNGFGRESTVRKGAGKTGLLGATTPIFKGHLFYPQERSGKKVELLKLEVEAAVSCGPDRDRGPRGGRRASKQASGAKPAQGPAHSG